MTAETTEKSTKADVKDLDVKVSKQEKSAKTDVITLDRVNVLIFRSEIATIADKVFAHEVPILRAVHGEEAVTVTGEGRVKVANFNANDELARLRRKYRTKEGDGDPVGKVYGSDARQLAKLIGVDFSYAEARKPAASQQTKVRTEKIIGRR